MWGHVNDPLPQPLSFILPPGSTAFKSTPGPYRRLLAPMPPGSMARSMYEVIVGCLATTIICVWASVHPNVPPPINEEYGWRSLARRLRLMFWTLVAPELVILWAARQWAVAGIIRDVYNNRDQPSMQLHLHFK